MEAKKSKRMRSQEDVDVREMGLQLRYDFEVSLAAYIPLKPSIPWKGEGSVQARCPLSYDDENHIIHATIAQGRRSVGRNDVCPQTIRDTLYPKNKDVDNYCIQLASKFAFNREGGAGGRKNYRYSKRRDRDLNKVGQASTSTVTNPIIEKPAKIQVNT
ncbi:unnamed protein product [Dovyalis caffra]|uniref:Uncharacterized protein n=1 Tax=Dovyalis caffra TaxID=77055 RepID=A0AAV1RCE0_9ROSI|nr:unnamed protein product [Dovyalis caffra]